MNIILFDFDTDGCIYNTSFYETSEGTPQSKITSANLKLKEHIQKVSRNFNVKIVGSGTSRQSVACDVEKVFRGGASTAPILPVVSSWIPNAKINRLMMADLYGTIKKDRISLYNNHRHLLHMLDDEKRMDYLTKNSEDIDDAVCDSNKITLVYAHMHDVARLHPNDCVTIELFDNDTTILEALYNFFSSNPEFMPSNVTLNLYQYDGDFGKYKKIIKGTGKIDTKYDWTVRYMAASAKYIPSETQDQTKTAIEEQSRFTADQMRAIHDNKAYHTDGHLMLDIELNVYKDAQEKAIKRLHHFRDSIAPDLESTLPDDQQHYVTVAQLVESGELEQELIPPIQTTPSMLFRTKPIQNSNSKSYIKP